MKTDLYAMKTNQGYGFFQKYEANMPSRIPEFSIIYRKQVKKTSEFKKVLKGEYYFQQLVLYSLPKEAFKTEIIKGYEITYMGQHNILAKIDFPYKARLFCQDTAYSLKYEWQILDLTGKSYFIKNNGEPNTYNRHGGRLAYKKLVPEIVDYPIFGVKTLKDLYLQFNTNYHPRDYNDEYVIAQTLKARAEMTQEDKKAFKDEWKDKRDDF